MVTISAATVDTSAKCDPIILREDSDRKKEKPFPDLDVMIANLYLEWDKLRAQEDAFREARTGLTETIEQLERLKKRVAA